MALPGSTIVVGTGGAEGITIIDAFDPEYDANGAIGRGRLRSASYKFTVSKELRGILGFRTEQKIAFNVPQRT